MTACAVIAFAVLGMVALAIGTGKYLAAQELLREAREVEARLAAKELADTLARESFASDWRHMSTRGGLN
jgi:Flp pilus assembly protein TadG